MKRGRHDHDLVEANLRIFCASNAANGRLQPVSATQSSLYTNTDFPERYFPAAKCIDGDTESPSHAPPAWNMCHTNGGERSPWLAIDYGSSVTVRRVEIFNREDCCGDRTKNVDVHVSNELPTSANQMFSGGSLLGHFAGPASNGEHIIISGEALSGRYVIVQMDISESDSLHFREVMAFGEKGNVKSGELLKAVSAELPSTWPG